MNAHWILQLNKNIKEKHSFSSAWYHCSNCNCVPLDNTENFSILENYCHKCGAYMIETPTIEINEYEDERVFNWSLR